MYLTSVRDVLLVDMRAACVGPAVRSRSLCENRVFDYVSY
jgi:hypothetical protein